ncbi:hypothetical protein DVA76_19105, partial [Acinetobacter baumannii]
AFRVKQLTQLEITMCLRVQVGHEPNASLRQSPPTLPPWWSPEGYLLIEQCVHCNTCAASAGEPSPPVSIETLNTAAQATPG